MPWHCMLGGFEIKIDFELTARMPLMGRISLFHKNIDMHRGQSYGIGPVLESKALNRNSFLVHDRCRMAASGGRGVGYTNAQSDASRYVQKSREEDNNKEKDRSGLGGWNGKGLQERLEKALLVEAEEEKKALEAALLRRRGHDGTSHVVVLDVDVSPQGRLYSDLLWKVYNNRPCDDLSEGGRQSGPPLKDGSVVFLCKNDGSKSNLRVSLSESIEASIVEVTSTREMLVAVSAEDSIALSSWSCDADVKIDMVSQGGKGVGLDRQLQAVRNLSHRLEGERKGARAFRAIILGSSKAEMLASQSPEWMASPGAVEVAKKALIELKNLNPSQKRAIVGALSRSMTLWQGPPGTGKTRTLLGLSYVLSCLVRHSPRQKSKIGKVLAVAETNAAADNLVDGMSLLGLNVVRVGPASRVRPELRHLCWEAKAEQSHAGRSVARMRDMSTEMSIEAKSLRDSGVVGSLTQAQELEQRAQQLWKRAQVEMISAMDATMLECDIVVSTCISAGDARLQEHQFRMVIIDEATQATEPSTLIPLTRGTECVVMAGDHAQLPPTIISKDAEKLGLNISLFARMQRLGLKSFLLDTQYRMHPSISEFPSMEFYGGNVSTGIHPRLRPVVEGVEIHKDMRYPHVQFIESQGSERRNDKSFSNSSQCDIAINLVKSIAQDETVKNCVILTPYNAHLSLVADQAAISCQHLVDSGWLMMSSVDGFQGREADVVIFCTVRCNPKGSIGFLKDARRMNVAITRARRGLVVIGSRETLSSDPLWRRWIEWVHGN